MEFNVNDIFNEVRSSVMSNNNADSIWKEKLKFEAGKEYILRLIPYVKEGRDGVAKKTLVKYQKYTWQDSGGKWHSVLSPRTWGGKCPIGDWSYRIKYKGTDTERENMDKRLYYKAGAYANVYVIKDPTNPENEGKVKILDMGKKIQNLITSALDGELDKSWTDQARKYSGNKNIEINVGPKVYDLSPEGVNLVIRVTKNQYGLNDYSTSEFSISDTDLEKTQSEINEIYQACHDLTTLDQTLDFDQITKLFKETYLNEDNEMICTSEKQSTTVPKDNISKIDDNIPSFTSKSVTPATASTVKESDVDDWFAKNGFDVSKLG